MRWCLGVAWWAALLVAQISASAVAEESAVVADSAAGGGRNGGVFFFVAEVDGKEVDNSLKASVKSSFGRGFDLRLSHIERPLSAGPHTLKLVGDKGFAAPIQELFKSSDVRVEGLLKVELKAGLRYRVTGVIDAFKRELWLEEVASGALVGEKFVLPAPILPADTKGLLVGYTCCNLHYDSSEQWISDANWVGLPFIPAGTPIVVQEYGRKRAQVLIGGRKLWLGLDYGDKHFSNSEQFVQRLVLSEDPAVLLASYPEATQKAIRAGKVSLGMSKEQVVMSLGYPRADRTPSLDENEWIYWVSESDEVSLLWGADARLAEVDGVRRVKKQLLEGYGLSASP